VVGAYYYNMCTSRWCVFHTAAPTVLYIYIWENGKTSRWFTLYTHAHTHIHTHPYNTPPIRLRPQWQLQHRAKVVQRRYMYIFITFNCTHDIRTALHSCTRLHINLESPQTTSVRAQIVSTAIS